MAAPLSPAQADILRRAHAELTGGNPAAAIARLRALLLDAPGEPNALQLLGGALRASGDLAGARGAIESAVAAAPNNAPLRNSLANLLLDIGDPTGAVREYRAANALDPAYPDAWINLGGALSAAGRHEEALTALDRATALLPRSAMAATAQGDALRAAGRIQEAIAAYRRALALEPGRSGTQIKLAAALREDEQPHEALAILERTPRSPESEQTRAAALIDLQRIDEGVAVYDRIAAEWPAAFEAHRARAQAAIEYGLDLDPYASFAGVAQRFPAEPSAWRQWAQALLGGRAYDRAREVIGRARTHGHDDPLLGLVDASASAALGDDARAAEMFASVIARAPDAAAPQVAFARFLLRSHAPDRAAAAARRATELEPTDQAAWAYLGTAWRMLDDAREYWLHDYDRFASLAPVMPLDGGSMEEMAEEAAAAIRPLHVTHRQPADQTLEGGTQTPGALFTRKGAPIRRLAEALRGAVNRYVASLPDDPSHPFLGRKRADVRFTGSWSVRLGRSGFHINHFHPQGWISSAYYLVLPDAAMEPNPEAGALQLGAPPPELGLALPPRRIIRPATGLVALFPSSMWHGTVAFEAAGERLTVAFDALPA